MDVCATSEDSQSVHLSGQTMAIPHVSIALCTYNGERHLPEQLASLLGQDYPAFDVVAVDDGSSDGTLAILREHAQRDPRLQVHVNSANVGITRNFEKACSLSHGDWIAPSDQDDVWLPNKLRTLVKAAGDASLVYCNSAFTDEAGKILGGTVADRVVMYRGNDPRVFAFDNCVSGHALICKRSLVERAMPFPEAGVYDWWLAFVAATVGSIEYVDSPLVRFRQHTASRTDVSGRKRERPLAGHRMLAAREQALWLEALRAFPDTRHQAFFDELAAGWRHWQTSYLTPSMCSFVLRHRRVLYALQRRPRPCRKAWSMLWGMETRRLTQPHAYRVRTPR